MELRDIQRLLTASGYYKAGIDGLPNDKMLDAATRIITKHKGLCTSNPASWSKERQLVGAAQVILHFSNYEPGDIDGYAGHNTENALRAWDTFMLTGKNEVLPKKVVVPFAGAPVFPLQKDCKRFYGDPEKHEPETQLVTIAPPYPMVLDWNTKAPLKTMRLHKKCADSAVEAMRDILKEYGLTKISRYGLDRFAGSYFHRKMRGGNSWSMHSYGCAIDFFAAPNGLTTHCPKALFCKPEYRAFFDIWESRGWLSLGRAIDRDWMHVQAARLK